jgi:hypothetical protein
MTCFHTTPETLVKETVTNLKVSLDGGQYTRDSPVLSVPQR